VTVILIKRLEAKLSRTYNNAKLNLMKKLDTMSK